MKEDGKSPVVCVLLSTYNGEKYIKEQILSIMEQKDIDVHLSVRDDGSTDSTASIIKNMMNIYSNISYEYGNNLGYERSFYSLLKSNPEYDYYAFSDDDDIWDNDKLISGIKKINEQQCSDNIPFVCWSALRLTDENLNYIRDMEKPSQSDFEKGRYILDRYGYGATMVFNRAMRDMAIMHEPTIKISHDNWIGLLAVFTGKYCFDAVPHISYRQHGTNIVGGDNNYTGTWKRRIRNFKKLHDVSRSETALNLLNGYTPYLSSEDINLLEQVAYYKKNLRNKIQLLKNKSIHRASKEKDFLFRIQVLFNIA